MMKEVAIITFDEMERIRFELDRMISVAKDGASGDADHNFVYPCIIDGLKELRDKFD